MSTTPSEQADTPLTEAEEQSVPDIPIDFSKMNFTQSIIKRGSHRDEGGDNTQYVARAGMMRRLMSVDDEDDKIKAEASPILSTGPDGVIVDEADSAPIRTIIPAGTSFPDRPGRTQSGESESSKPKFKTTCCFKIYEKGTNPHTTWPPKFHYRDILFGLWALFTFAFDYGTDVALAVEYVKDKEYKWFILTLSFIAIPSFISGIISVIWYKMTYKRDLECGYKHAKTLYYSRMFFSFIQLGRIFRQLEYLYCIFHTFRVEREIKKLQKERGKEDPEVKKQKAEVKRLRKTATAEKRDAAILGLIDGFMESALQLLLQLYLSVQYNLPLTFPRVSSLLSSWFSTAMIQTTYYRANRKANKEKDNVDYFSSLLYFLWRFVELGPRYIVVVLSAYYLPPWCAIFILFHVIYVLVLYVWDKPELEGICTQPLDEDIRKKRSGSPDQKRLLEPVASNGSGAEVKIEDENIDKETPSSTCSFPSIMSKAFILVMGLIGVLSFINLKEGHTFKTSILFYVVFYVENIVMVAVIIVLSMSSGMVPWVYCLFSVPVGLLLHVVFVFVFYSFCHPTNSICPPMKVFCCCCKQDGGTDKDKDVTNAV